MMRRRSYGLLVAAMALMGCERPQVNPSTVVGNPGKMTAGASADGHLRRLELPVASATARPCSGEGTARLVDEAGQPLAGSLDLVAGVDFAIERLGDADSPICEISVELSGPVLVELAGPLGTTARGELDVVGLQLGQGGELVGGPIVFEVGYPGWMGPAGVGLTEASDLNLSAETQAALASRLADGSAMYPDPDQDGVIALIDRDLGAPRGPIHPLSLGVEAGVVVVGVDGLQGVVSLDGATYSPVVEPGDGGPDLQAVATGPLGAMAAGASSDGKGAIRTSADLVSWEDSPVDGYIIGDTVQGGGRYVAIGLANQVFTSTDGRTFERAFIVPEEVALYAVTYADGRFIAGGQLGDDGVVLTSADGQTWSAPTVVGEGKILGVAGGDGRTVVVGLEGFLASSADTRTWTLHDDAGDRLLDDVVWDGERFLVPNDGDLLASADGEVWTALPTTVSMATLAWTGETYIGASRDGGLYRSSDAEDWEVILEDGSRIWRAMGVSRRLGEATE